MPVTFDISKLIHHFTILKILLLYIKTTFKVPSCLPYTICKVASKIIINSSPFCALERERKKIELKWSFCKMCSTFSVAAKPSIGESRGKILSQQVINSGARSELNINIPREKNSIIFPRLSTQGMLQSDVHIREIAERRSLANNLLDKGDAFRSKPQLDAMFLDEAYERCRKICAEFATTYYLGTFNFHPFSWSLWTSIACVFINDSSCVADAGTLLLTKERQKAIWAVYGKE